MKKLFSKILVLSLLLSGNALSEMPKFFGIVIGGTKAAELLKKDITFVKELKQLNYGTHKSYILDLKDPKSDYFYYFNYDTIKLNPKFQNSANIKGELGFRLWAEGKPLYDTYKDCNIYRNGFLKKLNKQYSEKGYESKIENLYKENLTFKVKSPKSKIDRSFNIWALCASNDGGGLDRASGNTRPKETDKVKFFLIASITDTLVLDLTKELYKRYEAGSLENANTDGF